MSDRQFERAVRDWIGDGLDRTPRRAIDGVLLAVKTTPQERDLRIPWRFPRMRPLSPAIALAAMALVAAVGAGGLIYLNSPSASGPGGPPSPQPTAVATPDPTATPTPEPSESGVAPGITGWNTYTSEVHGFTLGYPTDWSLQAPATRMWQAGDGFHGQDAWPFADTFVSPEQDAVGLLAWEMPAGDGADLDSVQGLEAWAKGFCNDVGESSCEQFTLRAVPMCLNAGGAPCRPAIIVPTAGAQYAFFMDWISAMFTNSPDLVRVVVVAREDDFPSAARYGGSVELLKAILTTMDVWRPNQAPRS